MPPMYDASNPPALAAVTIANSVSAPTNLLLFGTRPPTTAASGEAALTLFSTFSALGLDPLVPIEVQLAESMTADSLALPCPRTNSCHALYSLSVAFDRTGAPLVPWPSFNPGSVQRVLSC